MRGEENKTKEKVMPTLQYLFMMYALVIYTDL
jgi:hypothetical protein